VLRLPKKGEFEAVNPAHGSRLCLKQRLPIAHWTEHQAAGVIVGNGESRGWERWLREASRTGQPSARVLGLRRSCLAAWGKGRPRGEPRPTPCRVTRLSPGLTGRGCISRSWKSFSTRRATTLATGRTKQMNSPNHFLETNRLPLLRSVPGDRSHGWFTLGLPLSTGGRSGKR
jgi:hypothetical protein